MSSYDLSEWPLFRAVIDEACVNRNKSRACLVLSPAASDSDLKRHTDVVLKYIVQPALIDSEYASQRLDADLSDESGSDANVDALLRDDLVIALMTGRDPEVYYQVAIAQAAGRPLILMIEAGRELSVRPRGALVVTYTVDTDAIMSAKGVRDLNAAIKQFQSDTPPLQEGFQARKAMPRSLSAGGGVTFIERGGEFSYDRKMAMMREATQRIDILGVANASLARHPDMLELIRSRSGHDLQVRILQTAPGNPGIAALVGSRDANRMANVRNEIDAACEGWRAVCELEGLDLSITVRLAQDAVPLSYTVLTERAVIATPYQFSRPASESPSVHALAGSHFHKVMMEEFDALWSGASPFLRRERLPGSSAGQAQAVTADRFSPSNDASPRPSSDIVERRR